jgi:hypothetical protein
MSVERCHAAYDERRRSINIKKRTGLNCLAMARGRQLSSILTGNDFASYLRSTKTAAPAAEIKVRNPRAELMFKFVEAETRRAIACGTARVRAR